MKKHVYHVGDKVRILRPRFVRRVGYPLVWHEVEDVQLYADPRIGTALRALGLHPASLEGLACGHDEIPRHLQIAFAKEFVVQNNFGGKERSIYYWADGQSPPNVFDTAVWGRYYSEGTVHTVVGRRHVKTGVRYAAWGNGEDWEPGGLNDMKVHTLLKLSDSVEIEACNVEPMT